MNLYINTKRDRSVSNEVAEVVNRLPRGAGIIQVAADDPEGSENSIPCDSKAAGRRVVKAIKGQ
jgi:hypothetical protein